MALAMKVLYSLLFLTVSLVSLSVQQCLTPADSVRPVSEQSAAALLQSELQFSADLLHAVSKTLQPQQEHNVFFSPSSIFKALLLAYFISASQTEDSLKNLLHLQTDQDKLDVLEAYTLQNLYEKLRTISSPNLTVANANRLYHAKHIKVQPCMKLLFSEEIQQANFEENSAGVVKKINHWVADKTRHVIKEFLAQDQLSSATELVLVNAAHFKGNWKYKFDVQDTKKRDFELSNGTIVKTPMMYQENKFKIIIDKQLSAEVLELPYSGEDVRMFVILPLKPSPTATQEILSNLDFKIIQQLVKSFNKTTARKMELTMPKFTIDESLDLTEILESMNAGDLFMETADLSTLTGSPGLKFSEAIHKAKVRVDEDGTEAAAATAIISARMRSDSFIVDHPFVFLLYDSVGTVPFVGVFNSPK